MTSSSNGTTSAIRLLCLYIGNSLLLHLSRQSTLLTTETYCVKDPKDQVTITAAYDRWQTRNHQALAEITLILKKEPLRNVKMYQLASQIWVYLEVHYKGRGQHTMAWLLRDVFRTTLVDTVPMEQQLSDMRDKVHRLIDLGHDLKDSLIATVMIISLSESYASLRQHLYMEDETTLTTDFVIKQILMDKKSRKGTPHVVLTW